MLFCQVSKLRGINPPQRGVGKAYFFHHPEMVKMSRKPKKNSTKSKKVYQNTKKSSFCVYTHHTPHIKNYKIVIKL